MHKYVFDEKSDGEMSNTSEKEVVILNSIDDLKKLLKSMDVLAEAEVRYQNLCSVKHMKNIGGAQYIANSQQNFSLLHRLSEEVIDAPAYTTYRIRLTGQKIEL